MKLHFTTVQLNAIRDGLFDTLEKKFNWGLGKTKRKAAIATWLEAKNYDALLQRSSAPDSITLRYDNGVVYVANSQPAFLGDTNSHQAAKINPKNLSGHEISVLCGLLNATPAQLFDGSSHALTISLDGDSRLMRCRPK